MVGGRGKEIAENEANKLTGIMVTKYVRHFKHTGKMCVCTRNLYTDVELVTT